jgi:glutamate-ammonia-ligase adenylyltransferase
MDPGLEQIIARLPDPEAAHRFLARVERELPAQFAAMRRKPTVAVNLLTLAAFSPWLGDALLLQPDAIDWLGRQADLDRADTKEDYLEALARFALRRSGSGEQLLLAHFKQRELARIYLRDCLRLATLTETTEELSLLADALLERALTRVHQDLVNRHGVPQTRDERDRIVEAEFAVVALGKHGSLELNYASDIDLMFLYAGAGETAPTTRGASQAAVDNHTFFTRLSEALFKLVGSPGEAAPVYRVDLRLRPYGRDGDLAVRLERAVEYYTSTAQTWERQTLIRARCAAGSPRLVARFLEGVREVVFRPEPLPEALQAVRAAKEKIDRNELARGGGFNVKLGPGGIREVEFITQALQLAHGGRDPWVRAPRVLIGLQRLADKKVISDSDRAALSDAYVFLRTVEHRLQMAQGVQTHRLPTDSRDLEVLARRCGYDPQAGDPAALLRRDLERHTSRVRAIYKVVFAAAGERPAGGAARREPPPEAPPAPEEAARPLEAAARGLAALDPDEGTAPADRAREMRALLTDIASRLPNPVRAIRNTEKYLASLATLERSEPRARFVPGHERLEQLMRLLGSGAFFADILTAQPALAREIPGGLFCAVPRSRAEFFEALWEPVRAEEGLAGRMAALRRAWYSEILAIGCHDVLGGLPLREVNREQTELAEASLDVACRVAIGELAPEVNPEAPAPRFVVYGLGRLGHAGMDYGSDLDLLVVFDREAPVPSELQPSVFYLRLAQLVVRILTTLTREGYLYSVDLRLRPEGRSGRPASSVDRIEEYLLTRASAWELTAYLKIRPAAGDLAFGAATRERIIRAVFEARGRHQDLKGELRAMRDQLERRNSSRCDVKFGQGGMMDVYFVTRYVQLRDAVDFPPGLGTNALIEHLGASGSLDPEVARDLASGYAALRRLDHFMRLSGDPSAPCLPEAPDVHEELAAAAGFSSAAALDAHVKDVMRSIRAAYEQTMGF